MLDATHRATPIAADHRAPAPAAPVAPEVAAAPPAATDELSDADLDEVVGGLARAWSDHAIARLIRG